MQAELVFTRVKYISANAIDRPHMVVQGITGSVKPGTSLCILDGSGERAGEIFLKVAAGRADALGSLLGSITVNGGPLTEKLQLHPDGSIRGVRRFPKRVNSAYVGRGDAALWHGLTVREMLTYAALLRRTDVRSCPRCLSCGLSQLLVSTVSSCCKQLDLAFSSCTSCLCSCVTSFSNTKNEADDAYYPSSAHGSAFINNSASSPAALLPNTQRSSRGAMVSRNSEDFSAGIGLPRCERNNV